MGLKFKIEGNNQFKLGCWELNEGYEELLEMFNPNDGELETIESFGFEKRRLQWIATRILTNELCGSEETITYDEYGAPTLEGGSYISVSHSHEMVAVAINKARPTGVDIELIGSKIQRIKDRFLSITEIKNISSIDLDEHLHVYWGAKEALFKIYRKGNLRFSKNLLIDDFYYDVHGLITGNIVLDQTTTYQLAYKKVAQYMLVYIVNN